MLRKAVFLDRDGVLNVNHGYVHSPVDFEWIPNAPLAIKHLNNAGYLVIVITNQAGIAKGFYTESQFLEFMEWIGGQLAGFGANLDAVYYCPHHPTEGFPPYVQSCSCRKPAPGMIERAVAEWSIAKESSYMIGDAESDMLAARAAGIQGVLFDNSDLLDFVKRHIR